MEQKWWRKLKCKMIYCVLTSKILLLESFVRGPNNWNVLLIEFRILTRLEL